MRVPIPDLTIASGKPGGLYITLAPEYPNPDAEDAISVREDSFYIVESALQSVGFTEFQHWGENTISAATWEAVLQWLADLSVRISNATSLDDLPELHRNFEDVLKYWSSNLEQAKPAICAFIEAFSEWVRKTISRHDAIVVHGI